jgi:hypothetical protein
LRLPACTAARQPVHDDVVGRSLTLLLALAVSILVAGCSRAPGAQPTTPTACAEVFSAVHCQVIADYVAGQLHTTREQVADLVVVPQPTPATVNGVKVLMTYSGGPPVDVDVTLRDGSVHRVTLHCGGIPGVECQDDPHLVTSSVMHGGYFDHPCTGDQAAGCPSPVPSVAPDALTKAVPLRIARLDIPVDHVGLYAVSIGEARLPNGILTAADFALVEPWPAGVSILDGGVSLEIRSLDDGGKPITNTYEHGWRSGTERVQAVLVFNVAHFDPGATLGVKDVVVR